MTKWRQIRLRYVADLNPPIRADLLAAPETEVSFLPMEAIGEDGSLRLDRTRPVFEVRNGYSYFEDGDVAFAKVTPCFENGKGALMRGLVGKAGFGTTEITVLRPRPGTDARFLNYVLQSERFRQLGAGAMTGAGGLKRVPDEFTRNFATAWTDTVDQERIANFLDEKTARIDALIAEKGQLVEALRGYLKSAISSAATGESIGPLPPRKWGRTRIRFVADLNPPIRPDLLKNQQQFVSFLPMEAIGTDGSLDLERTRPVEDVKNGYSYFADGDVVVARVTPCFENGKGAVVRKLIEGAGFGTTELTVLRPREGTDARFLRYVLSETRFMSEGEAALIGAGGLKRVPDQFVRDFECVWPSPAEQSEISNFLDVLSNQIKELTAHVGVHVGHLREYRSSLISAAVTGQLDIGAFKEAA